MRKYLLLSAFLVTTLFLVSIPFIVKVNVECSDQFGVCQDEISSNLNKFDGKSLVSALSGVKKYLKSNFLVSSFFIQFKLPNILKVNLIAKKPSYAVYDSASKNIYLATSDGRIISVTKNTALPTVETNISAKTGEEIDPSILFAAKLTAGVFEMYQQNFGKIDNNSLVVDLKPQIKVIFPLEGDEEVLLGSLRLIYTKITSDTVSQKYSQIDLRFKNPVLR